MKLIYVLRAQCEACHLDKMITFYRPKKAYVLDDDDVLHEATPSNLFKAHEQNLRKTFKTKYNCSHDITFTREVDKKYKWDEQKQQPVVR